MRDYFTTKNMNGKDKKQNSRPVNKAGLSFYL